MSDAIDQLFRNNREWVDRVNAEDPGFFMRLANQQARYPRNEFISIQRGNFL